MNVLSADPFTLFVGYNVRYGSKANGTLSQIPDKQLIEMPVAENLMIGSAIGMSLAGFKPVVYFERFDFIMNAMDALVNHLDKIESLSQSEFVPRLLIRCIVGSSQKPLFTGSTHTQDFTDAICRMVHFPVIRMAPFNIISCWNSILDNAFKENLMIVECRDYYDEIVA